tara:strand:+ start:900 stop:1394 length:495 start_codon:yes stop_codon:yes gene_type:complete
MSFIKWHKNQVEKNLNMLGLSNYQGLWISFIKGLIFGAVIMWFVGCKEKVVIKNVPSTNKEITSVMESDYSVGVKGNCGMCKKTIENAVEELDFIAKAEWGISTKILDVKFDDNFSFDLELFNNAITESGYETMNTTANQESYEALPMCCKYDRKMQVYTSKSD